ncbi:MAG: DUF3866 family protein, partial [Actinobacteria bacterium]
GTQGRAICYPALVGECSQGDRVLLNTTAVDLGLGTGGAHFVVARAGEGVALDNPSGGHIMKLRYTPLQRDVLAVEESASPHHAVMRTATSLDGMPVVCCGLHSQVPLVAAAVKATDSSLRVAYCMTDFAALALGLSDVLGSARTAGLIDTTISCGQAFGGDLEAVNLHSGLLAARHAARAHVAVVAIGPGVVGTATPFGHGGVSQGEAINAAAALGGTPVAVLRVSFADKRERHRGVSHHTLTALSKVALAPAKVAIPSLPAEFSDAIESALGEAGVWALHERADSSAGRVPPPSLRGVEVTSMGRSMSDDPAFYAASFAAGDIASAIAQRVL